MFYILVKQRDRKYLAIEMESAGILASAYTHGIDSLIIRCISDFGDKRKKELDGIGEGILRQYAMNNGLALLWRMMKLGLIDT